MKAMRYEVGFLIPYRVDQIPGWKEKLERDIKRIDTVIDELGLPHSFVSNLEATRAAQIIKEKIGELEIITQISVEQA